MTDLQLTLTGAERECLVELLEQALKQTRVEEHRTRTPAYREHVLERENTIASLLTKVGHSAEAT